jgi:hypothetical protein
MMLNAIIAAGALFGIFILFLVLSKTLNNVLNQFAKLRYLLQKEYDLKKERIAISQLLEERKEKTVDADISDGEKKNGEATGQKSPIIKNNNGKTK